MDHVLALVCIQMQFANIFKLELCLYDFYNIIFIIKHRLQIYAASGSALPIGKFWVRERIILKWRKQM